MKTKQKQVDQIDAKVIRAERIEIVPPGYEEGPRREPTIILEGSHFGSGILEINDINGHRLVTVTSSPFEAGIQMNLWSHDSGPLGWIAAEADGKIWTYLTPTNGPECYITIKKPLDQKDRIKRRGSKNVSRK